MPGEGQALGSAPGGRTEPAPQGHRLGGGVAPSPAAQQSVQQGRKLSTTQQPAGTAGMSVPQREAAARAAEERAKAANSRGVNTSNPKAGKLSANLDKQRREGTAPEEALPERVIYD
ncbi:hypothetical protein CALCODRAFT_499912 [Calocera cornea HHB12733]|uniref:Uncharacterized protein n=1 Tax=Calocera cornea HHB12733 TaxID=1353952 RepID=A0A165E9F1_9BASI|nr:hypothetical protein CALCODRAFT_499912 [Calocera cornea HHB12733]